MHTDMITEIFAEICVKVRLKYVEYDVGQDNPAAPQYQNQNILTHDLHETYQAVISSTRIV